METSINDLQTRQVKIHPEVLSDRSDTVREQDHLSLHAPINEELSGGNLSSSIQRIAMLLFKQVQDTSSKKQQTSLLRLPSLIGCSYMRKLLRESGQHLLPVTVAQVVAKNGNYLRKVIFKVID